MCVFHHTLKSKREENEIPYVPWENIFCVRELERIFETFICPLGKETDLFGM